MSVQKKIGDIVREARAAANITQRELAEKTSLSQVTISRLEKNLQVSDLVLRAVFNVLKDHIPLSRDQQLIVASSRQRSLKVFSPVVKSRQWDIAYAIMATVKSGDLVSIRRISQSKIVFLLADAAGSGDEAAGMANALDFGFNVLLKALPTEFYHVDSARTVLDQAFRETQSRWEGPPSVLLGVLDDSEGNLEFSNSGMPAPLFLKIDQRLASLKGNMKIAALGSQINPTFAKPNFVETSPGDAFLFYSDGFRETFEEGRQNKSLSKHFEETARVLVGDSRGVLENLIDQLAAEPASAQPVRDDMSAIVAIRKRDI